jgi:hypothetical protein
LVFSAVTSAAHAASIQSDAANRDAENLEQCQAMFPNDAEHDADCGSFALKYHRVPRHDEMGLAAKASRQQTDQFWQRVDTMAKHREACEEAGACLTVTIQPQ